MQEDVIIIPESKQNVYICYNKNNSIDNETAYYGFCKLLVAAITLRRKTSGGMKNI